MGYPLKLHDGTVAILEIKPGAVLTEQDKEILREWVQYIRDQSDKNPVRTLPKKPKKKA